jgi:predicted ATPase
VRDFTGREEHVSALRDFLNTGPAGRPGATRIAAIVGPGGIGKSALGVHLAHQISESFPDGQLYVSLGATAAAVPPADALAALLRDLGVPRTAILPIATECAAKYRTLLADRRMLVVLDDADDAAQVRPLLPGAGASAVIVTSRNTLAGLAGAKFVELDPLGAEESRAMFAAIIGEQRANFEPAGTHGSSQLAVGCHSPSVPPGASWPPSRSGVLPE